MMTYNIFTQEWAEAIGERINSDDLYRTKAGKWEWPVVLECVNREAGQEPEAIYLDLWHGRCRKAGLASENDWIDADFVIAADLENWLKLYRNEIQVLPALLQGTINLKKGKYARLISHAAAAKRLVELIRKIEINLCTVESDIKSESVSEKITYESLNDLKPARKLNKLQTDTFPYRLYQKAKKLGIWNPEDIDFTEDQRHWHTFNDLEKEVIRHLTSLFLAGEESVTQDLIPLLWVIAREQRLDEELYLTTFLFEEAKHTDFFTRFLQAVTGFDDDLDRFHDDSYKRLFYEELPNSMNSLLQNGNPDAQLHASVTYNMIVEGVMAETGYHAYSTMLEENNLLPGLRRGIELVKQDESRHIAYGIHFLTRLLDENPQLWNDLQQRMDYLLEIALNIIDGIFSRYEVMPFGLEKELFVDFAISQFQKRLAKLEPDHMK